MKRPNSRKNLDLAIQRNFGYERAYVGARTIIADAIVAQMLPNGVIKGGSALKILLGDAGTRFTVDLDAARSTEISEYIAKLTASLLSGWEGFTGTIVPRKPATPRGIAQEYVMAPYDIKLSYLEKPWVTVPLEVGHNEIGNADNPVFVFPAEASRMLEQLGFPQLKPVPLMPLTYQIAQKLHGASGPHSKRAHDLIDLQLIMGHSEVDLTKTCHVCERLFAYRKMQSWPPTIIKGSHWSSFYIDQAKGLNVLQSVDEAIEWANELIKQIETAGKP